MGVVFGGHIQSIDVMLDEGAFEPLHAHPYDAGYDLRSPVDFILHPHGHETIDTRVHILIPNGFVGLLKAKSGLNVKEGIKGTGTIDAGYTGNLIVKLENTEEGTHHFRPGDKMIQIIFVPVETPELHYVKSFPETDRGENGFGSTGR